MACILHIDTSTDVCSVAVSEDSHVIFFESSSHQGDASVPSGHGESSPLAGSDEKVKRGGSASAEYLGSMVDAALSFADSHAIPFDAVAVSGGPGSYTGLRIGVSMAKGVCYGRGLQLVSVPTLELLCVPVLLRELVEEGALLCPMIDARRMEVYAAIYDRSLKTVRDVQADVVDADTYRPWLDRGKVYFFGNGAKKCIETIGHPNACYIDNIEPLAKWMQPLAERRLMTGQTEDVAYYEPFYLKDFVAKKPKPLLNI